ncbi:MAG: flavohemoglobin expression-modulating QEGLA motif protein [Bacteroidota bacterium]
MLISPQQRDLEQQYQAVFDIDANLDRLVHRIELLRYINPVNLEKEKQQFFASKYTYDPQFKYPKLKFEPYKLHRLFFSQRLERIKDVVLHQLYQDVIYYYANMIQCIETIGKRQQFHYNSLRVFGTPTERDVQNARFILHFANEVAASDMEPIYSPEEAKNYFETFIERYNFPLHVRFSTRMAADAMVSNSERSLIIKKNARFSKNQLLTLAHHEIGVHLVTTYNGIAQPLKIFSNGLPKNVETQEGLAVFSEYMGGALTLKRLKELSYRVLAADSLIKGYGFADTFDLIHGHYKLNRHEAFAITLRAHRGGGFTKDRLYLSGLRKIYKRYRQGGDMDILLTGKVGLDQEPAMKHLQGLGLLRPLAHNSLSFKKQLNTNPTLDFILNNLK